MPDDKEQNKPPPNPNAGNAPGKQQQNFAPPSLADELGIDSLTDPIFGGRGRLFSAAGRDTPVAEFAEKYLVLHPPQKPFSEAGPSEDIVLHVDKSGILLDELGRPKSIPGAKFKGHQLYWLGEQKKGTLKHYAGWFDEKRLVHKLYVGGEPLTTEIIFRLRNKTHDGEISIFPDLQTDYAKPD